MDTVCKIESRFLQLPFQALECSLHGIQPPTAAASWPRESTLRFHALTQGKYVIARIMHVNDVGRHEVDLTDQDHRNINEMLIKENLAAKSVVVAAAAAAAPRRGTITIIPG